MRIWPRRSSAPTPRPRPRPNPTRIAVLEHDLLGLKPEPGSWAAASIAMRKAGTCFQHQPVDISAFEDGPGTVMLCTGCGNHVTPTEDGRWSIAGA